MACRNYVHAAMCAECPDSCKIKNSIFLKTKKMLLDEKYTNRFS